MKKQALCLSLLFIAGGISADDKAMSKEQATQVFKQTVRTVDPYQVLQQLEAWKDLQAEMETEGKRRSDQIQKAIKKGSEIEKQLQSMGSTVKDSVKESKQLEMYRIKQDIEIQEKQAQHQLQQMYEKGQMELYKEIETVAREIAAQDSIMMIQAGGFLYADPSLDISSDIAKKLNKRYKEKKERQAKPEISTLPKAKL